MSYDGVWGLLFIDDDKLGVEWKLFGELGMEACGMER